MGRISYDMKHSGEAASLGRLSISSALAEESSRLKLPDAPVYDTTQIHGGLSFATVASPAVIFAELHGFLCNDKVPVEVHDPKPDSLWTVRASAFLDNVQVDLEVNVFSSKESSQSILAFTHGTRCDAVRFHRIVELFHQHAESRGFVLTHPSGCELSSPSPAVFDDMFDDFDADEDEPESWQERAASLLTLLEDSMFATRLEAVQMLAQWAETVADCRLVLARALCARPTAIIRLLQNAVEAPLCELYPMATALKCITSSPAAAATLYGPLLLILEKAARQDLPKLALGQFALTLQSLRQACPGKHMEKKTSTDLASAASTAFTDSPLECVSNLWCDQSSWSIDSTLDSIAGKDFDPCVWSTQAPPQVEHICHAYANLWE
jgi:hypothetical protein